MNESKSKVKWFTELNNELIKYASHEEAEEIISYYEEMIDDRMENGEDIHQILNDYHPKSIAKSMIPEIVSKRTSDDHKTTRNLWLIVLILFSTPILIPLGVVYLSIMIAVMSIMISGIAVVFSGFAAVIGQVIRSFALGLAMPEFMVSVGVSLLALVICLLIGYYMIKVSWWLLQHLAIWFSRLIVRKRDENENH